MRIKAGFVGFGEINSPKELINKMCVQAQNELMSADIELVTADPVADDVDGEDAKRAIEQLRRGSFDSLIICIAGWIPSHTVISITEEFKHLPLILWGLSGYAQENGHIVTPAPQAGTSALRKVFDDLGYKFKYVYNIIGRPSPIYKIKSFLVASSSANKKSKIGMMGFRDMKLYNTLYEGLSLKKNFGVEIEYFEMLEVCQIAEKIDLLDLQDTLNDIKQKWVFEEMPDDRFLKKGIAYYLAIKQIVEKNQYQAVSLKDVDGMKRILNFPPAMIFMLLSDEMNLCTIPENDSMGAVTQLIVKSLTGQCAAYLEFYEYFEKSVLMGVPDYVPSEIVADKVKVKPAAFGDISGGLLNISTIKTGQLTLVRLSNTGSQYSMHFCTGNGQLKSWEEAGWSHPAPQLPSLEIFLDVELDDFIQKISGQHYIIAYGDFTEQLKDFCYIKNIKIL